MECEETEFKMILSGGVKGGTGGEGRKASIW